MLPVLHPSFYAAYCHDTETDLLTRSIKKELAEVSKSSSHQQQQQQQHQQQHHHQQQHQHHERRQRMSMTKKGLLMLLFVGTIGIINVLCMAGTNGDNILEYLEWDEYIYPLLNLPLNHHICFVTAQYMSSKTDADNLVNLHKEAPRLVPPAPNDKKGRKKKRRQSEYKERQKSYLHFFAFTNRHDLVASDKDGAAAAASGTPTTTTTEVNANGWTVIVQEFPQFHRFITQSRWPKFQGYKHPRLSICEVIFYMDGTVLPVGTPAKFQAEARRILASDVKLSQEIHPKGGGIEGEMERCRLKNKDVEDNLQASLEWLKAQPDYTNDCVLYQNTFFGYANPNYVGNSISNDIMGKNALRRNLDQKQTNQLQQSSSFSSQMLSQVPPPPPRHRSSSSTSTSHLATPPPSPFATAADFLWDRFSKEVDSWRDQPLWCYVLHHFHIQPLVIPNRLFLYQGNRRPANDHTYGIEAATAAKVYYDERGKGSSDTTADEVLATSEGDVDRKSEEDGTTTTTTTTTDTITTPGALASSQ